MIRYVILCLAIGASAAVWMPYSVFNEMAAGLLIFLGLLVAALVQVIPVTANFLQADSLTPDEARKLATALEVQQKYWLGLLGASVISCIALITANAISALNAAPLISFGEYSIAFEINKLLSGIVATLLALVFIKMLGFIPGVMSLQKLRGKLVLNAAVRNQSLKEKEALAELANKPPPSPIVGADYGRIIPTPKH